MNVGYRISLNISVRYRNARQIFNTLFRYQTVRQQLGPISLITDVGLSAHLCLSIVDIHNTTDQSNCPFEVAKISLDCTGTLMIYNLCI
jgi:hypothetical protein